MPNKKLRCKNCKDYFLTESMLVSPSGKFHSEDCRVSWALANLEKGRKKIQQKEKKDDALRKKVFYASDLKTRKAAAILHCHNYIRERDKNKGCITCGSSLINVKFDAGHFMKSTHSYTKFMEKNIHGQCVHCNQHNGGEELKYYQSMVLKYGELTTKALMRVRHRKVKRSPDDYKEIEIFYKIKLKRIINSG